MSFSVVASSSPRRTYIGYALLPDAPPPPAACYPSKIIPGFVDAIGFGNDAIGVSSPVPVSYTHLTLPTNREV